MTLVLDSITELTPAKRGAHVVVGSHGGHATGVAAARAGVRSLICSDAGVGQDRAGIAALQLLGALRIPAATVSHTSAEIGKARDIFANGRISWANGMARDLGAVAGSSAQEAARLLAAHTGAPDLSDIPAIPFDRNRLFAGDAAVVLCDSASQIEPGDAGRIVVTGSHGGIPGDDPARACKADVAFVVFNDAGIGRNRAGISRLPALARRGIPAACVDCMSARIGDARSTYDTGVLSTVNDSAQATGLRPGLPVRQAIQIIHSLKSGAEA